MFDYSTTTIDRNLRIWFEWGKESGRYSKGVRWYLDAAERIKLTAERYGVPFRTLCGVVAALSPRCRWEDNIKYAAMLTVAHQQGLTPEDVRLSVLPHSKQCAWRILSGEHPGLVLKGLKVSAFYANLMSPKASAEVTVDSWYYQAAVGERVGTITARQYQFISERTTALAIEYEVRPCEFQAVVWLAVRHSTDLTEEID